MWSGVVCVVLAFGFVDAEPMILPMQQWAPKFSMAAPGSGYVAKFHVRASLDCARECSLFAGVVSFFYTDMFGDCECHRVTHASTQGLPANEPLALYFEKGATSGSQCPLDAESSVVAVLSDGEPFTVRAFMDASVVISEANARCAAIGGSLYTINSEEKFNFTMKLMRCPVYQPHHFWLNGMYKVEWSVWKTPRGEILSLPSHYWHSVITSNPGTDACLWMYSGYGHKLDDRVCDQEISYPTFALCEVQ